MPVHLVGLYDVTSLHLDGIPLEDDSRHIITTDRTGTCSLILDGLAAEDSGQYVCYATSSMGSAGTLAKVVVQGESEPGLLHQSHVCVCRWMNPLLLSSLSLLFYCYIYEYYYFY